MDHTAQRCPDCSAPLPPQARGCAQCGLPLSGPAAAELWNIDQAIAATEQQRQALLARRQAVLEVLRRQRPAVISPVPVAAGNAPPVPTGLAPSQPDFFPPMGFPPPPGRVAPRPARRESSSQSVQGLLLALGGLLLAVAAVVFTVVAWGRFGVAGRALILLTFTAIALGLPAWLVRRRLTATAETIALLGLVLMCMDAYAAYRIGVFGLDRVDGWGYAAGATAVIAAVAMSYPTLVPVRLIRVAGLFVAQLPVPLALGALPRVTPTGTALAATLVIALNLAVVAVTRGRAGRTPERIIAWILAGFATMYAVPVAAIMTFVDDPARPAAVLALAGLLIIAAAVLVGRGVGRVVLAGFGILQVGAAAVGLALPSLGDDGALAPAVAALLIALAALVLSRDWLRGAAGAAWVLLGAAGIAVLAPVILALAGPFRWLRHPWTGAPSAARAAVSPHVAWSYSPSVLATVLVITVAAAVLGSLVAGRRGVVIASHAGLLMAAAIAPLALDSTRVAALATQGAVAGLCCLVAALLPRGLRSWAAGAAGLGLLFITVAGALAERGSTLAALGVAAGILAVCAVGAGRAPVGAVALGLLGPAVAAEAAAIVLASGGTAGGAAWAVLGVAAAAAAAVHAIESRLPIHARALVIGVFVSVTAAAATGVAQLADPGLLLATAGSLALLACLRRPAGGEREAFLAVGALPLVGALALVGRPLVEAYVVPYAWLAHGWAAAAPRTARALAPGLHWSGGALVPAVLAVAAVGGIAALAAMLGRAAAVRCAVPVTAVVVGLLPLGFDLAWPVALATLGAVAVALLAAAAAGGPDSLVAPAVAAPTAAVFAATALAWSLAAAPATVVALSVLASATLLAAVLGRASEVARAASVVAGGAAVLDAVAATMAAGQPAYIAAFAALGVAGALALVAAVLRRERPWESLACEAVAGAGGLLGIALTAGHPLALSIALSVAGLMVGATALRPDRRWAWLPGTALLILSSWFRLADIGVTAPEAYTVPPAVVAMFLGWLRRRQRPMSSWVAYAPGLAGGLLPSLVALFVQAPDWARPLGLGAAALVVLLFGAWRRLQAPLLLGGGTLTAVAVHELAPAVAQLVSELPRWLPLGAAGLLLLLLGATYEQRRRDLRRVRDAFTRMA